MPNVKIGVANQSKTISEIKIGVNNQAKKVVVGYIGVNGQAKQFWTPNKSSNWCQDQTIYLEPNSTYYVEIAAGGGGAGTTNWGNGTSGGLWSGNVTTTAGGTATYGIGEGCPVGVDPGGGDGSFISFPDGCSETRVFVGGGGCLNDSDNVGGGGGGYGGLSSGWNDALGNGKSNGQGGQGYSAQGGYGNVFGRGPTLIALGTCDKKIGGNSKGNSSRSSQAATKGGYYLEKSNTTALNVGGGGAGGVYNGSGTPQPGKDGWLIIKKL